MAVTALIKIQWQRGLEEILTPAFSSQEDLEKVKSEIIGGFSDLWVAVNDGFIVTRMEGKELVLVAGVGKNYLEIVKNFQILAAQKGYSIRTHTLRKGIGRFLLRLKFVPAGQDEDGYLIYRWSANNGR